MEYADLHTHSTFSDGSLSPSEIVSLAKKENLKALALTDHDNISGLEEAAKKAKEENLEFINGVEFSCHDAECKKIHILGLFIKDFKKIEELASSNRVSRHASMEIILEHLRTKHNINLTLDFLHKESKGSITSLCIINKLLEQSLVDSKATAVKYVTSVKRPKTGCLPQEAIKIIKEAGGLSFWAHPWLTKELSKDDLFNKIKYLKKCGLNGVEAFHAEHTLVQRQMMADFAREEKMLISGGSDFHGIFKEGVNIGSGKNNINVYEYPYLEEIKKHL